MLSYMESLTYIRSVADLWMIFPPAWICASCRQPGSPAVSATWWLEGFRPPAGEHGAALRRIEADLPR